jgi:hypothetical protein
MARQQEVKTIKGTILRETDKAILFSVDLDEHPEVSLDSSGNLVASAPLWFPLSQVEKIMRKNSDSVESDELTISAWIAGVKGFEV